jgi:hypothetical protein
MTALENCTDVERPATLRQRAVRGAWIVMLAADAGLLVWCALAAVIPQHLPGPSSGSIVRDGYEGFTGGSWHNLVDGSSASAAFTVLVFRMFGVYGTAFSLMAIAIACTAFRRGERWAWWALLVGNTIGYGGPMTYDLIVHAVGPFELFEYVGIALVYAALAVTSSTSRSGACEVSRR